MKIFRELFSTLKKERVKYMVAGGVAVNLYGIERATADIDIVLKLNEDNILKFIGAVKKLGFKPKIPVRLDDFIDEEKRKEWAINKGLMVFSLYDPGTPFFLLDIFVEEPFNFDEVYRQRRKMKFEDVIIPVVPILELIKMKEKTGRPLLYYKTREDIKAYREKPVKQKLQWLEAQMEFFHKAMPERAKRIREKLTKGEL